MQRLLPVLFDWSAAAAFSYWRGGHSSHSRQRSARSEKGERVSLCCPDSSGRTTRRGGASGASAARSTTGVAFRSRMTRLTRAVWVPPSTVIAPSGTATVARSPTACSGRRMSQPSRRTPPSQRCRQEIAAAGQRSRVLRGGMAHQRLRVRHGRRRRFPSRRPWQLRQHSPRSG